MKDQYNLYGWGRIQKLPTYGFALEKVDNFTTEKIDKPIKKDKKRYILVVNEEYPKELHKKHNKLRFLAENLDIGKVEKLVPNLKDKKMYVVHIKSLNQTLKCGLKIKKAHWAKVHLNKVIA